MFIRFPFKFINTKTSRNDFTIECSKWRLHCPSCNDRNVQVTLQRRSVCSFL